MDSRPALQPARAMRPSLRFCPACRTPLQPGQQCHPHLTAREPRAAAYPSAREFLAATALHEHHGRCSYRSSVRWRLCDCHVLDDEYARRRAQP